jgi:hypothetical protein
MSVASTTVPDDPESSDPRENRYRYAPLAPGAIRLLRLLPNTDVAAPIQCSLFDYPIPHSNISSHLYDALSYTWGPAGESCAITVVEEPLAFDLLVRPNLYAALTHLRNPTLERIMWIDAVCINQQDDRERADQVQRMAEIYSKASRVVVWLGDGEDRGDEALETLRAAAAGTQQAIVGEEARGSIVWLVKKPWFQRIWVSRPPSDQGVGSTRSPSLLRFSRRSPRLGTFSSSVGQSKLTGSPSARDWTRYLTLSRNSRAKPSAPWRP